MDQSTKNLTKSTEASPIPTPGPSQSSNTMAVHQSIAKIRPTLHRNESSFTRTLAKVTESDNISLTLPDNLSTTNLDTSTKITIKEDINLVQEVHHESIPLTIPTIQTPLLTPLPIPSTKPSFIAAVTAESKKITWTKAGLEKYLIVIHSNEHTVFSPIFLANQTASTTAAINELDEIKTELEKVIVEVTGLVTPAGTPSMTPSAGATPNKPTTSTMEDYFTTLTVKDPVKNELKEKFDALRKLIARIRGIVVAAHVFYKINYALAADKRMVEESK